MNLPIPTVFRSRRASSPAEQGGPDAHRYPLTVLNARERWGFQLARTMNQHFKGPLNLYQRHLLGPLFKLIIDRLLVVEGLEHARRLPRRASFLLISNHRTFFDFFVLSYVLYRRAGLPRSIYFPVRANFFYQRLSGLLLNALLGGWSMYPPIFRERAKLPFNRFAMDEAVRLLSRPVAMVGIHPEGTRQRGGDVHDLLPAQPGVGRVALRARVPVLPAFVNGLENNLFSLTRRNWNRGEPVRIVFGEPLALEDLYAQGDQPPTHRRIADRMRKALVALGERERSLSKDTFC